MTLATFTIHLDSGAVLAANSSGLNMLGISERDALIGASLTGLLPGVSCPSAGTGWLPIPNGSRSYLDWTFAEHPERDGEGLLVLKPGDLPALENQLGASLAPAAEAMLRGQSAADLLGLVAEALVRLLDLRCARVLVVEAASMRELSCCGRSDNQQALRLEPLSLDAQAGAVGPAVAAAQTVVPVDSAVESLSSPVLKEALVKQGVLSLLAWPMQFGRARYVLELYSGGAGDLVDPVLSGLFRRWLPWLESLLASYNRVSEQRLAGLALQSASFPAFMTDTDGAIVWLNHAFTECYGHSEREALGATPRLIKSGLHGPRYYRALWSALRSGRSWSGETIDRGVDGKEVVVLQTISPVRQDGGITNFLSIHANITEAAEMRSIRERERGIDEITGLMTRGSFEDAARQMLATAQDTRHPLSLLMCVVTSANGMKPELDAETLAHVLAVLGQRVRETVETRARVGHLANLEFGVLLDAMDGCENELGEALCRAVSQPLPLLGDSIGLRAHTALVQYPQDGGTVEELILAADKKLADIQPSPAVRKT